MSILITAKGRRNMGIAMLILAALMLMAFFSKQSSAIDDGGRSTDSVYVTEGSETLHQYRIPSELLSDELPEDAQCYIETDPKSSDAHQMVARCTTDGSTWGEYGVAEHTSSKG